MNLGGGNDNDGDDGLVNVRDGFEEGDLGEGLEMGV